MQLSVKEALLEQLESDLVHFHRQRMADRQAALFQRLHAELREDCPNQSLVEELRQSMVQAERDKRDVSITEREVLVPLRAEIAAIRASKAS